MACSSSRRRLVAGLVVLMLLWAGGARAQDTDALGGAIRLHEVAFVGLQALDLHSTHLALNAGAQEGNWVMRRPLAGQIAIKAGMTTAVLFATERGKSRHPRLMMWMLTGINCAYAGIVVHNYRVYAAQRAGR